MRGKKLAINTFCSLAQEFVSVICGFILPRLILASYGSKYNGLIASITQFLSCAVLLRAGIGGVTRAALYKPLAQEDHDSFCAIVNATDQYMKRIGLILAMLILGFATIYPVLVKNDFGWAFTFSLVLIIGASTFAESFFGITYLIVLQADQRLWVSSVMSIICTILNTVFASILILNHCSIHIVKIASAIVFVLYPIVLGSYVRKKYKIDKSVPPNYNTIAQRWDAFWQQIAIFVMYNTDIMLLTIFSNMLEVSVYSVYNMVMHGLKRVIVSFSGSQEAAFGDMIARREDDTLRQSVSAVENMMFSLCTIVYACTSLLILDFVTLYTNEITDVNYIRPVFAVIVVLANFFNGVRLPYQAVVEAAGHFKQTKKGAIFEPVLNIGLSIIFVTRYGLVGVAIGTLAATLFRTLQYSIYMSKHIVKRSVLITLNRAAVSAVEWGLIAFISNFFLNMSSMSYLQWIIKALILVIISSVIVIGGNYLTFRKDTVLLLKKVRKLIK